MAARRSRLFAFRKSSHENAVRWFGVVGDARLAGDCARPKPAPRAPRPRRLAPGVLTVIPPLRDQAETFSGPAPVSEITKGIDPAVLNWKPNYSPESDTLKYKAEHMIFRRPVWYLEFAFKPLRMIEVDLPQPSGKFVRTNIWYLVYRIKNPGYHLSPKEGHFRSKRRAKPAWVDGPIPSATSGLARRASESLGAVLPALRAAIARGSREEVSRPTRADRDSADSAARRPGDQAVRFGAASARSTSR